MQKHNLLILLRFYHLSQLFHGMQIKTLFIHCILLSYPFLLSSEAGITYFLLSDVNIFEEYMPLICRIFKFGFECFLMIRIRLWNLVSIQEKSCSQGVIPGSTWHFVPILMMLTLITWFKVMSVGFPIINLLIFPLELMSCSRTSCFSTDFTHSVLVPIDGFAFSYCQMVIFYFHYPSLIVGFLL